MTSAPTSTSANRCRLRLRHFGFPVSRGRLARDRHHLARWYDRFRRRPSMRATEPSETPFDSEDLHSDNPGSAPLPAKQASVLRRGTPVLKEASS
jgi:hypothetical protein